jgi:hypothetical protein
MNFVKENNISLSVSVTLQRIRVTMYGIIKTYINTVSETVTDLTTGKNVCVCTDLSKLKSLDALFPPCGKH